MSTHHRSTEARGDSDTLLRVLLHPSATVSRSTRMWHSKGWLGNGASSLRPPAAGMCPGVFPTAKKQAPKKLLVWSSNVQRCPGAHGGDGAACAATSPARGVLTPPLGALETLLCWKARSQLIPASAPGTAEPPHPAPGCVRCRGKAGSTRTRCHPAGPPRLSRFSSPPFQILCLERKEAAPKSLISSAPLPCSQRAS